MSSEQEVVVGEALDVLCQMADETVDAIVTDPPYGLSKEPDVAEVMRHWLAGDKYEHGGGGFMGKTWDSFVPGPEYWRECHRVLKPGGHLLAFSSTRTDDLLSIAIRFAGFERRDEIRCEGVGTLGWVYGTGFPKSLNVSKAIDEYLGAERPIIGPGTRHDSRPFGAGEGDVDYGTFAGGVPPVTGAATSEAVAWDGWGTALKPAWEPILVFRKPFSGTVAENVLKYGTGALNIDGCRIEHVDEADRAAATPQGKTTSRKAAGDGGLGAGVRPEVERGEFERPDTSLGRWPANLVLDEASGEELDRQSGIKRAGGHPNRRGADDKRSVYNGFSGGNNKAVGAQNTVGGASRFFYAAKATRSERDLGCEHLPTMTGAAAVGREEGSAGLTPRAGAGRTSKVVRNAHPTVKPISLMRWLVRLVARPGQLVLDPFCGSGTTLCAGALENIDVLGIEREAGYVEIARARIAYWSKIALEKSSSA